ncbi:hypothetical protein GCM10010471_23420 [Leucobacter komagatae]
MIDILMPRLSDTMTEGTIAAWRKQPGDRVEAGDIIVEIETDKALMEQEAYEAGVLSAILTQEGEQARIGEPIARLDDGTGADQDPGRSRPETPAPPARPPCSARRARGARGTRDPRSAGHRRGYATVHLAPRTAARSRARHRSGGRHWERARWQDRARGHPGGRRGGLRRRWRGRGGIASRGERDAAVDRDPVRRDPRGHRAEAQRE